MKYTRLVEWSAKGDTLHLEMLGEDGAMHTLEVAAECAGALGSVLAAEGEKLASVTQVGEQLIRPTGMQTAKTEQGEPMILFSLKGGMELPLVFKAESLAVLVRELEGLLRAVQGGTQMRWN